MKVRKGCNTLYCHIYRAAMALPPDSRDAKRSGQLDRLGVLLSGLCAVHCLAGLALVSLLGIGSVGFGGILLNPAIHRIGLVLAVAIGVVTLGFAAVRHRRVDLLVLGSCGLGLMAAGILAPHGNAEALLTIAGVGLLATAHLRNLRAGHC